MMTRKWAFLLVAGSLAFLAACKKAEPVAEAPAAPPAEAPAAQPAEDTAAAAPAPVAPAEPAPAPQPPAAPVQLTPAAASLPGASDVRNALSRNDYAGAVVALTRVKASIRQDQLVEYNTLQSEVRGAIVQAMATDANAKRAYDAMRAIVAGR